MFPNHSSETDLGFLTGGCQSQGRVGTTYYLANFPDKCHGNKENWTGRGEGARPKFYYVDPSQSISLSFVFLRFTRRYGFATSSKGSLPLCLKLKPSCVAGAVALNTNRIQILILRARTSLSFHYPVRSLTVLQTILQECS